MKKNTEKELIEVIKAMNEQLEKLNREVRKTIEIERFLCSLAKKISEIIDEKFNKMEQNTGNNKINGMNIMELK